MDKQLEERIKARLAQRVRAKKNLNAGRKWNDDGGSAPEKKVVKRVVKKKVVESKE
jgi:hypothetical protein